MTISKCRDMKPRRPVQADLGLSSAGPHPRSVRGQPCPICGCNGERELIKALLARVAELEEEGRHVTNQQQRMAQLERRP